MAAEGDADIDAESNGPCYDTNVLARTLSWLDHNNPHWPMQSYEAARTAYHHHQDCPAMTCATYIAALYKIRKSAGAENVSDVLRQRAIMHTQAAARRERQPALIHTREQLSPHPEQPDVHLAVVIDGHRLDFAACLTSALWFLQEQHRRRFVDSVEVIPGDTTGLRRLPNERLYDGP
ncbi:hypothetical protein AB0346_12315 [Nocardia beijingensis]|uniref:hypothetical protein n=1 Tax=Nocardia beijingensis TaxID=95162 RepID=UPI001893D76F|nr:hypothetical protein [Nocardia beijingensis]MBF6075600.1 hypothetical protein [Nocardia beijingensis]